MIPSPDRPHRNLVPRWRSLSNTIASRELALAGKENAVTELGRIPPELVLRLESWRKDKNLITAAELVESAIVHGKENEAVNAARYIVQTDLNATNLVRKHAAFILKTTGYEKELPATLIADTRDTAHLWRERTRLNPYNPLAWVELALAQVSAGHDEHASRSMSIALKFGAGNRHVIRSAARLYLHLQEADKAHDMVRKNEATPHDPWLMAAEIALAPIADRKATFMKKGIALLEDNNLAARQVTELAGAVGTTFLTDGNRRRGKKLFQQSMQDPTGNSVAQAEWVSQKYNETLVTDDLLRTTADAEEANAFHFYRIGEFKQSLDAALKWIEKERFSGRAYTTGAVAANVTDDYKTAKSLTTEGLRRDPKSEVLLSTRVFALACLGELDNAEKLLASIPNDSLSEFVGEANRGLIALRRGQSAAGIAHYRNAIAGFQRQHNLGMKRIAYSYFAREVTRAGLSEAPQILAEAEEHNIGPVIPLVERTIGITRGMLTIAQGKNPLIQK